MLQLEANKINKSSSNNISLYSYNQNFLKQELYEIKSGKAKMISEDEFWASTDKVLAEASCHSVKLSES